VRVLLLRIECAVVVFVLTRGSESKEHQEPDELQLVQNANSAAQTFSVGWNTEQQHLRKVHTPPIAVSPTTQLFMTFDWVREKRERAREKQSAPCNDVRIVQKGFDRKIVDCTRGTKFPCFLCALDWQTWY
jgi:hypothetical protein